MSIEIALYSMITYLSASKTLDFVVEGIEEYMGVTIVSSHSEEIAKMIISDMERGITVYSGKEVMERLVNQRKQILFIQLLPDLN